MRTRVLLLIILAVAAFSTLFIGMDGSANAQTIPNPMTATPQPSPTNNGGKATWKINAMDFQAHWPKSFDFSLDATSTGGKIVQATVFWKYSPSSGSNTGGKIDAATNKVTASWDTVKSSIPQWTAIDYWWLLKDEAGNTLQTPHKYTEYADDTRKWTHQESEDVEVYMDDGVPADVGQMVIDAVRKERPLYFQSWGKLLNFRPHVVVYSSYKPWEEWDSGAGVRSPTGVHIVGLTEVEFGGTVQLYETAFQGHPIPNADQSLAYGTVVHEIEHLYQNTFSVNPDLCWFYEGDATAFEVYEDYDYLARVKDMAASGDLASLQDTGPSCSGDNARDGYDIGYAFWKWIGDTFGPTAHKTIWLTLAQGQTVEDSIRAVTGKNLVDTETDFRSWLGMANPVPPTLIPTPELSFPPTPDPNKQ